jgi:hypothetical protein
VKLATDHASGGRIEKEQDREKSLKFGLMNRLNKLKTSRNCVKSLLTAKYRGDSRDRREMLRSKQ